MGGEEAYWSTTESSQSNVIFLVLLSHIPLIL